MNHDRYSFSLLNRSILRRPRIPRDWRISLWATPPASRTAMGAAQMTMVIARSTPWPAGQAVLHNQRQAASSRLFRLEAAQGEYPWFRRLVLALGLSDTKTRPLIGQGATRNMHQRPPLPFDLKESSMAMPDVLQVQTAGIDFGGDEHGSSGFILPRQEAECGQRVAGLDYGHGGRRGRGRRCRTDHSGLAHAKQGPS